MLLGQGCQVGVRIQEIKRFFVTDFNLIHGFGSSSLQLEQVHTRSFRAALLVLADSNRRALLISLLESLVLALERLVDDAVCLALRLHLLIQFTSLPQLVSQ